MMFGGGALAPSMASAGARAYNGGLEAEPPAGSRGRAHGQGVRGRSPLKLKAFWKAFCKSNGAGKFSPFLKMSSTAGNEWSNWRFVGIA